jgi:release factor glutamine methyltransferase
LSGATWTILDLIRWTDERFQREGLSPARLDAEVLLAASLGMNRIGLYTHYDQPLRKDELTRFRSLVQRRLHHEPVAYILGRREFWSLSFQVTKDVLIPRPETELLVEETLNLLGRSRPSPAPYRILEIGTGCGAIIVALAHAFPGARLVATDVSPKALQVAIQNAADNGVRDRIQFLQGDLFTPLRRGPVFDLIVTNPPYIPRDQVPVLPPEVRDFEPRIALDGGKDGLEFYGRALPEVDDYLCPGGWFLTEMGYGQDRFIRRIAEGNQALGSFAFVKDLSGKNRVFKTQKKKDRLEEEEDGGRGIKIDPSGLIPSSDGGTWPWRR